MAGFDNRELARKAGRKSKRGPTKPDKYRDLYLDLIGSFKSGNSYVYKHIFNGEIIYIGKGTGGRAWDFGDKARNDKYNKFCKDNKNNIDVRIVCADLSSDESLAVEMALIKTIQPRFNRMGLFYHDDL